MAVYQTRLGGGLDQGSGSGGGDDNGQNMVKASGFVDRLNVRSEGNRNPG